MREYLKKRLEQLRAEYESMQNSFIGETTRMNSSAFGKNSISMMADMIDVKARIDEVQSALNALGMYEMSENPH